MLNSIPQHPYPQGTRVHDATEADVRGLREGTATVVGVRPDNGGLFRYEVLDDSGARREWPSYFTIPAGLWSRGEGPGTAPRIAVPAPAAEPAAEPSEEPQRSPADRAALPVTPG